MSTTSSSSSLTQILHRNAQSPKLAWHFFKHLIINSPSVSSLLNYGPITLYNSLIHFSIENNRHHLVEPLYKEMRLSKIDPDVRTVNLVILTLCDSGRLEDARKVFDNMPISLYNSLIRCLIRNKRFDLIEILYKEMRDSKVEPDVFTMNLFMMALCDLGRLEDAQKVFDNIPTKGCRPNEFSFGILIRGYCKLGMSLKGLEVMCFMERPNMVIYNTLVSGFCREGKVDEAEKLVERMKEEGISPNVVTFNARISGLCKARNVLEAYRIFRDMEEGEELGLPKPNQITYNLMLDGFCRAGMVEEGRALVGSMKKIGVFTKLESYDIWLAGLVKNGRLLESRALLEEMAQEGMEPSIYSYNIVIDGLCKEKMIANTKSVLGLMRNKGVLPDTITYTTLIHGYCTDGNIKMANKTLEDMLLGGCFPNTVTCNILLQSLWKEGKSLEAEKLLHKMKEKGHELDIVSCNIVINGLCMSGKLDKAIEIVRGMWCHGSATLGELGNAFLDLLDDANSGPKCLPDLITYSTLINGLCKVGRIDEAKKQLLEMMSKNISPDQVIYDTFIHGYCKHGKVSSALKVVKDMKKKGFKLTTRTYNLLIWGLGKKLQINEIQDLMNEMQVKGVQPDVITYNNLIYCLCEGGIVNEATSVVDEMMQIGIMPNATSYRLLIKAFCKACQFEAAWTAFQASLTTYGEKETLYRLMCNELCTYGKVLKAKEVLQIAIDKGFKIENFVYLKLIEELCKGGNVDDARSLVISLVNKRYKFDPAAFMPLIDALTNLGDKHEANKLSEQMLDMAVLQDKSFGGVPHGYSNEVKYESSKLNRGSSHADDWYSLLHRDDGSGIALKVLKRVQKGWGQGTIRAPRTKKINFLNDFEGAE